MNKLDALTEEFKAKLERFLIGCDSVEEIDRWDKDKYGEMDLFYQNDLISIIIRLIAADGKISLREVEYLNKNFGFDYTVEELTEVYENCCEEVTETLDEDFKKGITLMRSINTKLADAYKELLETICDIIIESDDVIAPSEIESVKALKEMF